MTLHKNSTRPVARCAGAVFQPQASKWPRISLVIMLTTKT